MPLLSHEDAIKLYWEQEKNNYPNLTFRAFEQMCKSPYLYTKESISSDHMPFVYIKYIGKFRVFKRSIKERMYAVSMMAKKGYINREDSEQKRAELQNYLEAVLRYDTINKDDESNEG